MKKVDVIEIDLTSDDEDARSRIMQHATRVLAQREPPGSFSAAPSHQQEPEFHSVYDETAAGARGDAKRLRSSSDSHNEPDNEQAGFANQAGFAMMNPMNDLLKALHQERIARQQRHEQPAAGDTRGSRKRKVGDTQDFTELQQQALPHPSSHPSSHANIGGPASVRILTYNIWFEEGVALRERMRGLVDIINQTQADILFLQEVTHNMLTCWQADSPKLLEEFTFSPPPKDAAYFTLLAFRTKQFQQVGNLKRNTFPGTHMGRDVLSIALAIPGHSNAPPLLVATSHLESPTGRDKPHFAPRELQVEVGSEVLTTRAEEVAAGLPRRLGSSSGGGQQQQPEVEIVWGGDMNWIHSHKSEPRLPAGWQDVWPHLYPREKGSTWDATSNAMLKGCTLKPGRLDRFFARLNRWQAQSIEVVGTEPLPGLSAVRYGKQTPVLVSDHFGLLLQLTCSA